MKITNSAKIEQYKKEINVKIENKELDDRKIKKQKETVQTEDKLDISILKVEADKANAHLRQIVEDLLKRQGYSIKQLAELKPEDIKVNQKARNEAKQMIEEGGPLSPESVSTRIVDFAKAISGDDKSKFNLIKDSIEEGFEQAKEILGGELPEISQETHDLVMEKLDAWYKEE